MKTISDIHWLIENLQTYVASQDLLNDPVDLLIVYVHPFDVLDLPWPRHQLIQRKAYF
jgi:hypothetical protein